MKFKVVWPDRYTLSLLSEWNREVVRDMSEADVVLFTGGADINPALYGHDPHPRTFFWQERDDHEVAEFQKAKTLGLPMAGICRGGQLINAMLGGTLLQHVPEGVCNSHDMVNEDGTVINVPSVHHQVMVPGPGGTVLFTDVRNRLPEVVAYPGYMCYQSHPEYRPHDGTLVRHFFKLVETWCKF